MYGYWVSARWTAPDGRKVTGTADVRNPVQAGGRILLWVTRTGRLTSPPLTGGQLTQRTMLAVTLAPVVLAVLLLSAGVTGRLLLNNRRMANWDEEWEAVRPTWTRQR